MLISVKFYVGTLHVVKLLIMLFHIYYKKLRPLLGRIWFLQLNMKLSWIVIFIKSNVDYNSCWFFTQLNSFKIIKFPAEPLACYKMPSNSFLKWLNQRVHIYSFKVHFYCVFQFPPPYPGLPVLEIFFHLSLRWLLCWTFPGLYSNDVMFVALLASSILLKMQL